MTSARMHRRRVLASSRPQQLGERRGRNFEPENPGPNGLGAMRVDKACTDMSKHSGALRVAPASNRDAMRRDLWAL